MPTITALIAAAADLASDNGENVEYDRALVELIATFLPGDSARAYVESVVLHG